MWKMIETSADIQDLMDTYGGFHDSCLKEVRYYSGMFVDSELGMGNTNNSYARLIFQRQYKNPSVIEMEFVKPKHLNIPAGNIPIEEDFLLISDAIIKKDDEDDIYYWAEDSSWDIETGDLTNCLWVASEKIRWRIRKDDDLGEGEIYTEKQ